MADLATPRGRFPHLKVVGDLVFVSGTSARNPDNSITGAAVDELGTVTLDIRAQTRAVIENIERTLSTVGATLDDIVDITSFLISRRVDRRTYDIDIRLKACDDDGVGVQVLSTVPVMFSYWAKSADGAIVAAFLNDDIASTVAANPGRFVGLGTLPLEDTALAITELQRCVSDMGLAGIEIGTHILGKNLNASELFPVFEAAADLGAAVFVHPWDMMGMHDMVDYWLPWLVGMPAETSRAICSMIFGGVFERLPKLRVAFAHGGGSFPGTVDRIQHGFEVQPDLCAVDNRVPPKDYLGRFWVDSLVHNPRQLTYLASLFGGNRVCLGTGFPFPLGEQEPGATIRGAEFDPVDEVAMLGGNALEWLGMERMTNV
ncbi:MAG: amidohydrolase family protein [bacterium]|nr:amidohydrolase family protein [bacterium]